MTKKNEVTVKDNIEFFIEKAIMLSLSFEEQYKELVMLGDYITEDIASDWIWRDLENGLTKMCDLHIINDQIINLYKTIDNNFKMVSLKGVLYDENIWTLDGLKNHPFWDKQRILAKILLTELYNCKNKIGTDNFKTS